jgi:hypothetical protein
MEATMQSVDNEELRQRVDAGVSRKKRLMHVIFFAASLIMFIIFMVMAVGMLSSANLPPELVQGDDALVTGAFVMLGMGWFTSLVFQAISMLTSLGVMDAAMRDRVIAREIGRQLYEHTDADYEKPKRRGEEDMAYAVSDDGELIELDEEAKGKTAQS